MNIKKLVESRTCEFDYEGKFYHLHDHKYDKCECVKHPYETCSEKLKSFLSESIHLAYLEGLQRAKELVVDGEAGKERGSLEQVFSAGFNTARKKTLQNIDNEIKSYENNH